MFEPDEDIADTRSEGAGVGFGLDNYAGVPNPERGAGKTRIYTVFNSSAKPRRELVELTVWDYAGDFQRLEVVDHAGKNVPMQLVDSEPQVYWDHRYVRVLIMADVPALTGAYAASEGVTAALITDCKYGYRLADNVLSVTLINTSGDPDPYPERGIHAIKIFVALTDGGAADFKAKARMLISPMTGVPTARHEGALAPRDSLMEIDTVHCVVSSVQAQDDALLVRLYETDGVEDDVVIHAPFAPRRAELTKLDGTVVGEAAVMGRDAAFRVLPNTIAQVRLVR